MERGTRKGTLPEDLVYRDTGCDLAPSCLRCPLPSCRYDPGSQSQALARRDERVVAMALSQSVDAASAAFGLSKRTVFRALEKARRVG